MTNGEKREITVEATLANLEKVTEFVNEQLEQIGCPPRAQMQIDITIDELFSNISFYAYNPEVGMATISIEVIDEPMEVILTFSDNGTPYDPLDAEKPDVTLSAEERKVGGLGIYIVKQSMDEIAYEYKDGKNILKVKKKIN